MKKSNTDSTSSKGKSDGVSFKTVLLTSGKTATGFVVPAEVVERLGGGKKPAVNVTINGGTYRSTVATMNGKFMIGVSAENREKTGVKGGDAIEVTLELDTKPREVNVPAELKKALDRDAKAKKVFEGLSYSNQLRHALAVEGAKTEETRLRRLEKVMSELRAAK